MIRNMKVGNTKVSKVAPLKIGFLSFLSLSLLLILAFVPARAQEENTPTPTIQEAQTETPSETPSTSPTPSPTEEATSTETELPAATTESDLTPSPTETLSPTPLEIPFSTLTSTPSPTSEFDCAALGLDAELCTAVANGEARVIVELAVSVRPLSQLNDGQEKQQEARIEQAQADLEEDLQDTQAEIVREFETLPFLAIQVDQTALVELAESPLVADIQIDQIRPLLLAQSVPLINAPQVWSLGFTGAGQTVAILDTGIDKNHPFITASKVVAEACFSSTGLPNYQSVCPNGTDEQIGPGAGEDCPVTYQYTGCSHGTHVAGIVAGRNDSFSGVAPDATLISVQVFSKYNVQATCGPNPCVVAFDSDIVQGLEYVYQLRNSFNIAAVNMSLGGGSYSNYCNSVSAAMKVAIDNLRSAGIATVIASGNGRQVNGISFPACISSAISVGASTETDAVAEFSNSTSFLSLLAPGASITSSVVGGYQTYSGTSMAAPHVAGVFALLKDLDSSLSVDQILSALRSTGKPITDTRIANRTIPRVQAYNAFRAVNPKPPKPVLIAPLPNASVNTNNPLFSWNPTAYAEQFRLQIYLNKTLTSQERSILLDPGIMEYKPGFLKDGTYYWQVVGVNHYAFEGTWSNVQTLTIDTVPPLAPMLTAPVENSIQLTTTPKFVWTASTTAVQYELQVSDTLDFSNILIDQIQTGLNYTLSPVQALDLETNYWRIRSKDLAGNWSNWSLPRQLTISLLSMPANGTFTTDSTPRLQWLPAVGALEYNIQLDEAAEADFLTPVADQLAIGLNTILADLDPAAYVWRLRFRTASGWSSWSNPWALTISPAPPGAPLLSLPANNALLNDSTPDITWNAISGAATYEIQIANTTTFALANILQSQSGIAPTTFIPSTLFDGKYYVRVRAQNTLGRLGAWSAVRVFNIDTAPPATPNYLSPAPGATSAGTPVFSWTKPPTATQYQLQIDLSAENFDTPEFDSGAISSNSLKPAISLFSSTGEFAWRVRARDAAGNWGGWTAPRALNVILPLPAAPAFVSPANLAVLNDPMPSLNWNAASNADSYMIQISTMKNFSSQLVSEHLLSGVLTYTPTFLPDGVYYWRVRGFNLNTPSDPGPYSSIRTLTIDTNPPVVPTLLLPAPNASVAGAPTFSWNKPAGATQFQLQINDGGEFDSGVISTTSLKPAGSFSGLGSFTWRVRVRDAAGNWSDWSSPRGITITLPLPAAPTLGLPSNNFATNQADPVFTWTAVPYGSYYEIWIDSQANFAGTHESQNVGSPGELSFQPTLAPGKYYWRVRALNTNNQFGAWSAAFAVTIDLTPPAAPVIVKPANAFEFRTAPSFQWAPVSGAASYELQIDEIDEDFSDILYDTGWISKTLHSASLSSLGEYQWRLRARDLAGNLSPWTDVRTFKIIQPLPSAPALSLPAANATTSDNTPSFAWQSVALGSVYQIQIGNNSNFLSLERDQTLSVGVLTYTPVAVLPDGTYYWRVRAWNSNVPPELGAWSVARKLIIK